MKMAKPCLDPDRVFDWALGQIMCVDQTMCTQAEALMAINALRETSNMTDPRDVIAYMCKHYRDENVDRTERACIARITASLVSL
jgi:hypothetical protein